MQPANILIAGGTGLIGSHLIPRLQAEGDIVSVLSRKKNQKSANSYLWDPSKGEIDKNALLNTTAIFNLAGSGIADHRWSDNYKKQIVDSRIQSAQTLFDTLKTTPH